MTCQTYKQRENIIMFGFFFTKLFHPPDRQILISNRFKLQIFQNSYVFVQRTLNMLRCLGMQMVKQNEFILGL